MTARPLTSNLLALLVAIAVPAAVCSQAPPSPTAPRS